MTTTASAIIAGVIAAVTVGAGALMTYNRERFEQERIRSEDERRNDRERMYRNYMLAQNQCPFYPPVPSQLYPQQPQVIPMYVNNNGVAQMDVNWVDALVPRVPPQQNVPLYCDSPVYQNTSYINPRMEFTFGDNDSIIKAIASKPPMASPIFGIH